MSSSVLKLQSPSRSESQPGGRFICFIHQYDWQESATGSILVEKYDPCQIGGWMTSIEADADGNLVLVGGMTTYEVNQPIKVDNTAGTVTLEVTDEPFATIDLGSETTVSAGNTITVSKAQCFYVVNEEWILNEGDLASVEGRILDDGSIVIDGGFGYYIEDVTTTTITSKGVSRVMSDTTRTVSLIYRDTRLMVPNGKHEFVNESNGEARSCDVYMYQSNDTVYVMNLYGYGWGENFIVLNQDGTMSYPEQPLRDIVDADYPDGDGLWYNTSVVDGEMVAGNQGEAAPEALTWGLTRPSDHDGRWYGWDNNVLYFTNDQEFVLPSSGLLRGDANGDGIIDVSDITALIDALLSENFDGINLANADASLDDTIGIEDVTMIADYLLVGLWPY